jgi:hypothetical protein
MEDKSVIMTRGEWEEYTKKYNYNISYESYRLYAEHVVEEWKKYEREI